MDLSKVEKERQNSGGSNHDTIKGGAGHDLLIGHDGDDLLYGNSGDDDIEAGAGTDMQFGRGNDKLLSIISKALIESTHQTKTWQKKNTI